MPYLLVAYFLLVNIFFLPSTSHAYIDPGTGSLILQALVAAGITALAFLRGVRMKIAEFFRRVFRSDSADKNADKTSDKNE